MIKFISNLSFYKNLLSDDFFGKIYLGNHIIDYIASVCIFVVVFFLTTLLIKLVNYIITNIVNKTSNELDNKILEYIKVSGNKMLVPFIYIFSFYVAIYSLNLSKEFIFYLDSLVIILVTLFITRIIIDILKYYIISKSAINKSTGSPDGALYLLFPIIKVLVWIIAIFFILSNLNYNITTLLTGFGIGGIAIAFAAQAFLGDILSFVSIVSDKPFEIGDYISINGVEGFVLKIGIKSVRIASVTGEEIVIPNTVITSSKLQNFRKSNKRIITLEINIPMKVPNEKLILIPDILKKIISEREELEFIRSTMTGFSEYGYTFKTVYSHIINTSKTFGESFDEYMQLKQYVNLRLRTEMDNINVEFAYPTQDVRVLQQKDK